MHLGSTTNGVFVDKTRRRKNKTVRAMDGDTVSMQMHSTRTEIVGFVWLQIRSIQK